MMLFASIWVLAYTAGSINFSILLFRWLGKGDPRNKFSGNPGATNVYRQAGPAWAVVVLLLDMGRAVAVALAALYFLPGDTVPWIGFGLIAGNRFPCFHGFRGGKGVANYFGFTAALTPLTGIIAGLVWLAVYGLMRIPFFSSFAMVFVLAAGTLLNFNSQPLAAAGVIFTAVFIFLSHKRNMMEWMRSRKAS